jgi:pimeloyl-ACP methyl ester carboxylesterase
MASFVLVQGAWFGGWYWRATAQALRKAGHEVYTPTLTGLGERIHLMSPAIDLDTHIADIVNVIKQEQLSDVVLVGHSYGGMVVTGVADALPAATGALVYLDAFVPGNGDALVKFLPASHPAPADAGAYTLAPLPASFFGANPEVAALADARMTPMPAACFTQPLRLTGGIDRIENRTYIYCNVAAPTTFTQFYDKLKNDKAWKVHTLPCTHLVQIEMPGPLADLLIRAVPA